MRLQLFKGTYAALLFLAMVGLFLMLRRGAGDGFALLAWLGLVVLGAGGLVATGSDALATAGSLLGLISTAYLEFVGSVPAGVTGVTTGHWRVELTLGAYVLLSIVLIVIWRSRRHAA